MAFLNPQKVLEQLDLKADMSVAEFGCGSGGFTVFLAKKLDEGIVHAIDILAEPLSALKSRMRLENIKNVRIIKSDLEKPNGSTLANDSVDLVVIPNVLFEAENKKSMIAEAKRVLKIGGVLAVIDWNSDVVMGPNEKVSKKEVLEIAEENNLKYIKDIEAGSYHYGLVFVK